MPQEVGTHTPPDFYRLELYFLKVENPIPQIYYNTHQHIFSAGMLGKIMSLLVWE